MKVKFIDSKRSAVSKCNEDVLIECLVPAQHKNIGINVNARNCITPERRGNQTLIF